MIHHRCCSRLDGPYLPIYGNVRTCKLLRNVSKQELVEIDPPDKGFALMIVFKQNVTITGLL